jgi:PAS domain S-box-containing protein
MTEDANDRDGKSELRRRAEGVLQTRGLWRGKLPAPGEMAEDQLLDLMHEIQVHQIELEMQNEELRETQAELAAARDRYFDLFDLAPVGYFMLDEDAYIVEANLAGAELLGVKRSELNGRNLTHFVDEQDRDKFFLLCQQVYHTQQRAEAELRFLKAGGEVWYADLTCAQVKEPDNEAGLLRIILRDVTALRVGERNLKSYATRLEGLYKDLESFTYIASHDLQEPLRKILQFGEHVKNHAAVQANEDLKDYVQRMQNAAARMQTLINDLLAYSRISNRVPAFETLELNQVVGDVLEDLEARIMDSEALVEVGDLPIITAEPILMRQLFQNLIGNALKFHEPGKSPLVKIEAVISTPELVEICVADDGIGFDELDQERIFRPFERLHNRNEYEGAGIGLAICRKIVERHSGSLTARSKPGQGSTFVITLPVQQA